MATAFENFVNTELPKRIATNESPTTPQAGDIPIYTGVGLLTESKTPSEAGLATEAFATNAANIAETSAKSYADGLVTSIYKFQTTYDPQTTGNFPTTANTVGGVAIKKGFTWVVSGVTGQYTFQGVTVDNGDTLLALVDNASATSAADWHITEKNLGYTPENQSNKVNNLTDSTSTTKYTSVKAVVDGLATKEPAIAAGTTAQYLRGDKTWQTLNTDAVPETANHVYLSPAQKTIATQAATATLSGYLSNTDWSTFNSKKSLPEVKSASFTAEINKAYSLGTPTTTLNIQFPTGTVTGQEIITHINRAALTYTVFAVPAAGQHVAYIGAGTYQIVSGYCDHILRWVFNSSNSVWELLEIVPAGSIIDTLAFCSGVNIQSRLKFNLPTATGTYNWYTPAKNINFGDLPNVATNDTNSIALAALRCRILGGSGNTVSGTGNVLINCTGAILGTPTSTTMIDSRWTIAGAPANVIAIGVKNTNIQTQPLSNTVAIGSANNDDLFTYPVAAATFGNSLFASSDSVPVSGTLYATTNGSQTLSATNCIPIPSNSGTAQYEVDFIVSVGAVGLGISTACNATGCISMRRIFTVFKNNSGAAVISAVDTVGTDRTLGAIGGTFTPTIALSGATHVTVGITRAGGAAGQEAMAISCRVRAHLTR